MNIITKKPSQIISQMILNRILYNNGDEDKTALDNEFVGLGKELDERIASLARSSYRYMKANT